MSDWSSDVCSSDLIFFNIAFLKNKSIIKELIINIKQYIVFNENLLLINIPKVKNTLTLTTDLSIMHLNFI